MRTLRAALASVVAALVGLVPAFLLPGVAGAAEGPLFSESVTPFAEGAARGVRYPMTVNGTFVPLAMKCGTEYRILWYAPGAGADSLWRNLTRPATGEVSKVATPLTVNGVYRPFVGDFDGDGCDDVFWYAPGPGADGVWYFSPSGAYTPTPVTVNGTYVPVVGNFAGGGSDADDEILWYSPGAGPESFWVQRRTGGTAVRGTFDARSAPAVNGTYTPLVADDVDAIVWFGPGAAPDSMWVLPTVGTTTAGSRTLTLAATGPAATVAGAPFFWNPTTGSAQLSVWGTLTPSTASLRNLPGLLGPAAVVAASTARTGFTVIHQPGPGTDWLVFPRKSVQATAVAAGGGAGIGTSCASVGPSGVVQCWGNQYGPGLANTALPRTIAGVTGATSVSSRASFGCAVAGGQVRCWGDNRYGRLGRPTTTTRSDVAAPVTGIAGASKVATGNEFACALVAGTVRCWGRNEFGQLGNGSTVASSTAPVTVTGIAGATDLDVGATHACAVVSGSVRCWGNGGSGRLGAGASTTSRTPVTATGLTTATRVATGTFHTCAVRTGGVSCWGTDASGELGNGAGVASSLVPVPVVGLSGTPLKISAAYDRTCVVSTTNDLRCWGSNFEGSLGTGVAGIGSGTGLQVPPTLVGVAGSWKDVAVGDYHSCGLSTSGVVACWGRNGARQLGQVGVVGSSVVQLVTDSPLPAALLWWA